MICQLQSLSCPVVPLIFKWIWQTWCPQVDENLQEDPWGLSISRHPSSEPAEDHSIHGFDDFFLVCLGHVCKVLLCVG